MNELKVNEDIHELLKALFLTIEKSIADDVVNRRCAHYEGKYFLCERSFSNESGFECFADKNYLYQCGKGANHLGIAESSYKYLTFKIFGVLNLGSVDVIKNYISLDFSHDFLDNISALPVKPEDEDFDEPGVGKTFVEERIYMVECMISRYFINHKEIMEEDEKLKQEYKDYVLEQKRKKEQEAKKEKDRNKRIDKMAEDIESAIEAFNKNKQKENEDEK